MRFLFRFYLILFREMELELNAATAVLGAAITVALGATYLTRPAAPVAHPFLLGRQSIISRTRNGSESPVYSSSSTGGMRAPLRPEKRLRTLEDILAESKSIFQGGVRGNWAKGGDKVTTLVTALRAGLLSTLGAGEGTVAVLVEDPTGQSGISPRISADTDALLLRRSPRHPRSRSHEPETPRRLSWLHHSLRHSRFRRNLLPLLRQHRYAARSLPRRSSDHPRLQQHRSGRLDGDWKSTRREWRGSYHSDRRADRSGLDFHLWWCRITVLASRTSYPAQGWTAPNDAFSEFDRGDGFLALALPGRAASYSTDHQRRRHVPAPPLDAVRIRILPLLSLYFRFPQSRPCSRLCRSSRRAPQLRRQPSDHSPRRSRTDSRIFAPPTYPQQDARRRVLYHSTFADGEARAAQERSIVAGYVLGLVDVQRSAKGCWIAIGASGDHLWSGRSVQDGSVSARTGSASDVDIRASVLTRSASRWIDVGSAEATASGRRREGSCRTADCWDGDQAQWRRE